MRMERCERRRRRMSVTENLKELKKMIREKTMDKIRYALKRNKITGK